jgi:hypothetical protein
MVIPGMPLLATTAAYSGNGSCKKNLKDEKES